MEKLVRTRKISVFVPEPAFHEAEAVARSLGWSRSQLYARALTEYLERRRDDAVTAKLDEIHDSEGSQLAPDLAAMQAASLPREAW